MGISWTNGCRRLPFLCLVCCLLLSPHCRNCQESSSSGGINIDDSGSVGNGIGTGIGIGNSGQESGIGIGSGSGSDSDSINIDGSSSVGGSGSRSTSEDGGIGEDDPCRYDDGGGPSDVNCPKFTVGEERVLRWGLRNESWVIPLMALAVFNLTVIAFFELFVLVKTLYARPSRRHLFLGQMLLLGLFASSLLGFAFVTRPNAVTCTLSRLGVGLAYALVLSTLLVKCVFLISLNNGVYLPATYLGLLLFFAVAVQLVEGVQWLVLVSPAVVGEDEDEVAFGADPEREPEPAPARCSTGFTELLLSLVYVMFLLFFAGVLAIKSSGIRENYREATYVAVAVGALTVVWLTWMVTGLVMGRDYEDACVAFGLVGGSSLCFLVMFLPKGRQLAALGQEGLYVEDRDDVLSDATPPSAYAPSFYHFTPVFVPPWEAAAALPPQPRDVGYKNAVPDRKCHKFASVPGRGQNYRSSLKLGETGHIIAGRHVNVGAPNLHSSMMY